MSDSTTTVAFIEHDTGFKPGHIKDIKQGNIYFLVVDGKRGQIHEALADAEQDSQVDAGWRVRGRLYE